MKKMIGALSLFFLLGNLNAQNNLQLSNTAANMDYDADKNLTFLEIREDVNIPASSVSAFINESVLLNTAKAIAGKPETDELGYTHIRYTIVNDGSQYVERSIVAHIKNSRLRSLNGDLRPVTSPENSIALNEKAALEKALEKVNAVKYKWDNVAEERHMREALNDPSFTYYPHGKRVIIEKSGVAYHAWQFNIYAEEPLYRANVFVNASTGAIIAEHNLICNADVPGTAATKYSGTRTITCNQNGSQYQLKETGRGLGVETYNMLNTSTYASNNFTSASTSFTTTGVDQGATDAHWGAEMTYDYYMSQHNRNSINNAGFKLISYVHYQTNYVNAFWDGSRMTYGDGNGTSYKIFTTLDICGHEITHGLTANTANLTYQNESGALNEAFSDIFGACIENYGRPTNWNWKMGEDMTSSNNGLRNMANPNLFQDPDTYMGTYWYTGTGDNGGVHTNSNVGNFWFYLLTMGGSGVNDLSNSYSVSALGFTKAAKIAFRALTVYFTASTNYANARLLTIKAASDLYGACSNEVTQTANAWYAVGVGAQYNPNNIGTAFTGNILSFCSLPANVTFTNTTSNGLSYTWDFGDGTTSAITNPAHSYTANGTYSVKLKATGCNGIDSLTKSAYIVVNVPPAPASSNTVGCMNNPALLSGSGTGLLQWFATSTPGSPLGVGNTFMTPPLSSNSVFYVSNTFTNAPATGGMTSNTGGGYYTLTTNWLIFDVLQPSVLNSVVIYAQTSGNRTIQLRNSSSAVLSAMTVSLSAGANTVNLNFNLTPGTNFQLALTGSSNAYRSTAGVAYPYNIGGCVNIINSTAGPTAYYFFYNWVVTQNDCVSPMVPVSVSVVPVPTVNMVPSATLTCSGDMVNLTGTPAGGNFSGAGVSGSLFNTSITGPGTFTLTYTYSDMYGCGGSSDAVVTVEECLGLQGLSGSIKEISIHPNPANESFILSNALSDKGGRVFITDASGRVVHECEIRSAEQQIDVHQLSKGLYLIRIESAGSSASVKLVKD